MPRTTLMIEDDAIEAARAYAARHRLTLGEAVSELVRQGAERPLVTESRSGLKIIRLRRDSPTVTAVVVDQLRDELP